MLSRDDVEASVRAIEARDAELKRVRALPTGTGQVAAVITHIKGGGRSSCLRWPYTLHAVLPGRRDTIGALARALCDEDAAVREFAAGSLGSFGPAAGPAVPALVLATTDRLRM